MKVTLMIGFMIMMLIVGVINILAMFVHLPVILFLQTQTGLIDFMIMMVT